MCVFGVDRILFLLFASFSHCTAALQWHRFCRVFWPNESIFLKPGTYFIRVLYRNARYVGRKQTDIDCQAEKTIKAGRKMI